MLRGGSTIEAGIRIPLLTSTCRPRDILQKKRVKCSKFAVGYHGVARELVRVDRGLVRVARELVRVARELVRVARELERVARELERVARELERVSR